MVVKKTEVCRITSVMTAIHNRLILSPGCLDFDSTFLFETNGAATTGRNTQKQSLSNDDTRSRVDATKYEVLSTFRGSGLGGRVTGKRGFGARPQPRSKAASPRRVWFETDRGKTLEVF
jgi:hypothetical protein